jgi:LPS-assembly protein
VSVPLFSFDGGLFFERDREGGALQTLEPRLFYLYAPYQAQAEIPVFDSGAYDFGLAQLFRENRFSGTDRIADANQLTLALSTRLLDAGGRETLSAGIGQIVYFDDRRVQLSGDAVTTDTRSPIVTELKARLDRNWSTAVSAEFDSKTDQTTQSQIRVSYRETGNRLFNLTHRYSREDVVADPEEQVDLSAAWPLNSSWLGYARWNYSLDEENTLNSLIGLEYDSCCWSLRLLNRRYLTDNGDTNRSVYLQLVLKSLGDFGRDAGTQLQRDILGYSDPYN